VTDLPFADAAFDVVTSQHVQMNVADKPRLYDEAAGQWTAPPHPVGHHRWGSREIDFPLPWADWPRLPGLAPRLRAAIEAAGFTVGHWADLTSDAATLMQAVISDRAFARAPLGLHAFVPGFAAKAANLTQGLASGRLRVIQAVALADGAAGSRIGSS
jgi:hypothetical protein